MKLSTIIVNLLNSFADSQPALRIPAQPLGSSNPELGTAINALTDYAPATPGNWAGTPPASMAEALDRLAALTPGA